MSTAPTIPPDIAASAQPDWRSLINAVFVEALANFGPAAEASKEAASGWVAELTAGVVEFLIDVSSEIGRRVGASVDEFEAQAGPEITKAAAAALSDYFNVSISPGQIARGRAQSQKFAFSEQLGRFVLESLFGAFEIPKTLTPDAGRENAERILGFNLSTAIEGWLGNVVSHAPLARLIPNWADLDTIVSQSLGLGRVNRRILGPLLKVLVADRFEEDLNRRFTPSRFSETELVRLLNRRNIDQARYFEEMSWHGWSQADAAKMLMVRSRLPEKEDVAKMLELGLISEARAQAIYEGLGFTETGAEAMVRVTTEDRVRSLNNALESLGRDMYRDKEIDEAELRALLTSAGRSPQEIELLVGVAHIERSRPRLLPRAVIEEGFRKDLIPLSRLREYYASFGFALEDQVLLEELAVADRSEYQEREEAAKKKAEGDQFRAVPRGQIEKAYIEGRVSSARLNEYYLDRDYDPADVNILLENAAKRKADYDRKLEEALAKANTPDYRNVPRASMEEAFIRGVIGVGRLSQWYEAQNFPPGEIPILLGNAKARKQEREEALADELRRANTASYTDLPRSVMEEAFYRDVVTEARLVSYYQAKEYRPEEIPILLELARQRKAERAAKAAKAAAGPGK